jgi:phospholipid/cholesterol/gamma-HCH transport system substrate-binding protein
MVTQAPARSRIAIAMAFILSCVGLIIFVWTQFGGAIPFAAQGYTIKAVFTESGLLVPGADVRISGITIGRVTGVQAEGVKSLVTIGVQHQYAPVPVDTRAILREKTLLGEGYVELSWGNRNGPKLHDGETIPNSQVESTQQLDQVLDSFNTQTQHNLQALLDGTYAALYGRGEDLNDAVGNLAPTVTYAGEVVDDLDRQRPSVKRLISNTATVLTAVGDRSGDLQSLITAGDQVLSATAARDTQLTDTVDALPPFLTQLRSTLGTLNTTLGLANPTLTQLLPVGSLLKPALSDVLRLAGPAIRLLHQAPGLVNAADGALPSITTFADAFRPAVKAILPATEDIVPIITLLSQYKNELVGAMANVAAATEATAPADTTQVIGGVPAGTAHYGRVLPPLNSEMFFGQSERPPSNRHNAYIAPGGWTGWATGLPASDCNNLHDTNQVPVLTGNNIPCVASKGFTFDGLTQYYPHVTAAQPPK